MYKKLSCLHDVLHQLKVCQMKHKCSLNYIWKARSTFKVIENRSAIWYFLLVVCIYCVYLAPFLRHYHFHSVLAAGNFAKSFISNKQLALKATDAFWLMYTHTHTHTHPFNSPLSGTTQVSRYQKGKTNLDLLEQETVSGSGISGAVCKSAPCSRQITMPAPHHSCIHTL